MSKVTRIACPICGKMFEPCVWCQGHNNTLRWRAIACSPECARIYIARAEAYSKSQTNKATKPKESSRKKKVKKITVEPIETHETIVEDPVINTFESDAADSEHSKQSEN